MEEEKQHYNPKRVLKNTLMLYIRYILVMFVSLFTVRIVFNVLGSYDYGVYSVVAGIVSLCGFLSGVMASASQRYFSFDLGQNNVDKLSKTFSTTLLIYFIIILIISILAQTIGLWWVNNKLIIEQERMFAVNIIYQTAIVSFLITLLSTPYKALITAHEDMKVYAYVGLLEVFLKLALAYVLYVFIGDKLIIYGILMLAVSIIIFMAYYFYCAFKYKESKYKFYWDKKLFWEIVSYSSWNLFGNISTIIKNQGITIMFNMFSGPLLNAAQNIAIQIRGAINSFADNFSTALKPQITKTYAAKEYRDMFLLVNIGSKITYFLLLMLIIPLFYNLDYLIALWLKDVPPWTIVLTQLTLLEVLFESLSYPMATANQATGKIALYQTVIGLCVLMNLPVDYLLLKIGRPYYEVYIVGCIIMLMLAFIRFLFLKRIEGFSLKPFLAQVLWPLFLTSGVLFFAAYFINLNSKFNFSGVCLDMVVKFIISLFFIFLLGFTKIEKKKILNIVKQKLNRR